MTVTVEKKTHCAAAEQDLITICNNGTTEKEEGKEQWAPVVQVYSKKKKEKNLAAWLRHVDRICFLKSGLVVLKCFIQ